MYVGDRIGQIGVDTFITLGDGFGLLFHVVQSMVEAGDTHDLLHVFDGAQQVAAGAGVFGALFDPLVKAFRLAVNDDDRHRRVHFFAHEGAQFVHGWQAFLHREDDDVRAAFQHA